MKRSEINNAIKSAKKFFEENSWVLPPRPKWDVTDFGLGDFKSTGLVLVNLAEEPEYCEKIIYAVKQQLTPLHTHKVKKEDIICRVGKLNIRLWEADPELRKNQGELSVKFCGEYTRISPGQTICLKAGERITIEPGTWHEFFPESEECIIGEVSTANDDLNDNFFSNENVGRFSDIEEDEPPFVRLVNEQVHS